MVTSTPPENSSDVYKWLSRFINIEQGLAKQNFNLDKIKRLAEEAGHPETCAPSIHVAGSKGKGSVTGMIAAVLEAGGIKTARYSSPHVSDFRERISRGGVFFDEEIYSGAGKELMDAAGKAGFERGDEPSFFELLTLWFFLCARRARCGAMAVETGMGGRLDATNILEPLASVITLIELEHTEYLGNSVAAIAGEKAGIIKPLRPLVLAEQPEDALAVFMEHAARQKSPLFYFPDCAEIQNIRVDKTGTSFTLVLKSDTRKKRALLPASAGYGVFSGNEIFPDGETIGGNEIFRDLFVPVPGEVQAKNSGLAVLALAIAFPQIPRDAVYKGLAAFSLPARFERVADKPPLVIDGAHTKRSVEMCLKTFTALYGSGGILIFGCAEGKDVLAMAEHCVPCFSVIIITTPGTFKKSNPEEIYGVFTHCVSARCPLPPHSSPPEILFVPDTAEAIDRASDMALRRGLPILGTGSFYLAGEIRKKLKPPL